MKIIFSNFGRVLLIVFLLETMLLSSLLGMIEEGMIRRNTEQQENLGKRKRNDDNFDDASKRQTAGNLLVSTRENQGDGSSDVSEEEEQELEPLSLSREEFHQQLEKQLEIYSKAFQDVKVDEDPDTFGILNQAVRMTEALKEKYAYNNNSLNCPLDERREVPSLKMAMSKNRNLFVRNERQDGGRNVDFLSILFSCPKKKMTALEADQEYYKIFTHMIEEAWDCSDEKDAIGAAHYYGIALNLADYSQRVWNPDFLKNLHKLRKFYQKKNRRSSSQQSNQLRLLRYKIPHATTATANLMNKKKKEVIFQEIPLSSFSSEVKNLLETGIITLRTPSTPNNIEENLFSHSSSSAFLGEAFNQMVHANWRARLATRHWYNNVFFYAGVGGALVVAIIAYERYIQTHSCPK